MCEGMWALKYLVEYGLARHDLFIHTIFRSISHGFKLLPHKVFIRPFLLLRRIQTIL